MNIPHGASAIIEMRKAGMRPADMVLVSLVGTLQSEINLVVTVGVRDDDFRFLYALEALIVCNIKTPRELIKRVADDVVAVEPAYAGIWWQDKGDGLHLCWGKYRPKAKVLRRWTTAERASYASHT